MKSWESDSLKRQLSNLVLALDFGGLYSLELEVFEVEWEEAMDEVGVEDKNKETNNRFLIAIILRNINDKRGGKTK